MCNHYHPLRADTPKLLDAAFTRRRFLGGMAMVSAAMSVPGFVDQTTAAYADTNWHTSSKPSVPEDRILVVVQLSGGNDGLNTVAPFGSDIYHKNRPSLSISEDKALKLDGVDGLGLNPALRPIHEMIGQGKAAVINGVGYPNPNRSHFKSMDIWHTARTDEKDHRGVGWIGRALDTAYPNDKQGVAHNKAGMACITIGNNAPTAVQGKNVKPVSFQRADLFRWTGHDIHQAVSQGYDQIQMAEAPANDPTDPLAFVYRTSLDAQAASAKVRKALSKPTVTKFPTGNPLANQLQPVARMINAGLPTRVYYVNLGGFDTHAKQSSKHTQLLSRFAQAMQAFYAELEKTGHADRVVSLAFSEFGRRLRQNASGGTDHGVAGPCFVFGSAVNAGIHGSYPSLTELDKGDLIHTTDFRSLYADILDNWMAIDPKRAVGGDFKPLGLFTPSATA